MQLALVDTQPELVERWRRAFAPWSEVTVHHGDILALAHTAIVSPANSLGLMDGGIDALYINYFGTALQKAVLNALRDYPDRELPVGASVLVRTGHARVPWLIVAPTMQHPGPVPPSNCFFAMAAILRLVTLHPKELSTVFCPGLATGTGLVAFDDAAREMATAYRKWKERAPAGPERAAR